MKYIELNKTGIVNGIIVECLPMKEEDADFFDTEEGVCGFYGCAFHKETACTMMACCDYDRKDKTSVYFKKL